MKVEIGTCLFFLVGQSLLCSAMLLDQRYARSPNNTVERSIENGEPIDPDEFEASRNIVNDEPAMDPSGKDVLEGDHFEGDIIIDDSLTGKNGIISSSQMWSGGVIPYTISSSFGNSDRLKIANAMDVYHSKTCIKFVPKTSQHSNWINIMKGSGCSSYVGKSGRGSQDVSLGNGCVHSGIIQHELMHAAGFWHEQSRHDRDDYVTIHWDNIQSSYQSNFRKVEAGRSQTFGQSYDYGSVMHYGRTAFATNRNKPTISPKRSGVTIGQRSALSTIDIAKLNAMYKCGTTPTTRPTTRPPTTTGPKECKDKYTSCAGWSERSECDKNASWMKKNCPVSCGACEVVTKKCEDKRTECARWSKDGLCERASVAAYMSTECPKSCKVCSSCND